MKVSVTTGQGCKENLGNIRTVLLKEMTMTMTMTNKAFALAILVCLFVEQHPSSAFVQHQQQHQQQQAVRVPEKVKNANTRLAVSSSGNDNNNNHLEDPMRRLIMQTGVFSLAMAGMPTVSQAAAKKSRTDGYNFQKNDEEWKSMLTSRQYDILRNGGTERQYSSILEGEERDGTYYCAGCRNPLFASKAKFHSGTGWPSFAAALDGVETEKLNIVQANLGGAEVRCQNCGGHLGDVFRDGYIFVGTPAANSGKRFCIDGGALVFKSTDDGTEVVGDEEPSRVQYYYN